MKPSALIVTLAMLALANPIVAAPPAGTEEPLHLHGVVEPIKVYEVKSEVGGRIRKLYKNLTNRVKKGDLLAEIEQHAGDAPSSKAKVLAPGDGTIVNIGITEGQAVTAGGHNGGTALLVIGDLSRYVIEMHVSEADAVRLNLKQPVQFIADAYEHAHFEAAISFIAPVSTEAGSVKGRTVRALVAQKEGNSRLLPGMIVKITVPASNHTSK